MRSVIAVMGFAVLSLAGAERASAHDPLDPRTRIGKPGHVVHSHDGTRVYRANGAPKGISVLDAQTLGVLREIVTDEPVDLVALSEDGLWLCGISPRADHIVVIETATGRVVGRLLLRPRGEPR